MSQTTPLRIRTIDAHTGGEPLRIITEGYPVLQGDTILERRANARAHHDHLRRALMLEPRGHADMYGAIPCPPATPDGDLGVLFLHNEGYSTMCGHGIIALTKVAIEFGMIARPPEGTPLRIDSPAGRIDAYPEMDGSRVASVRFQNVPSFVAAPDRRVHVPGIGQVRYDLAFGGAFYAYVDVEPLGFGVGPEDHQTLVETGRAIKQAVAASGPIVHPEGDADLGFLYGTIFVGPSRDGNHSRNVCVFADGEVDRSPTGTGVSGRAAIHHARGDLATGDWITIESIIGSTFDVRAMDTTTVGEIPAIVPEVRGTAHVTGEHTFILDPADPLGEGFMLR